jgi:hypothetical protein
LSYKFLNIVADIKGRTVPTGTPPDGFVRLPYTLVS